MHTIFVVSHCILNSAAKVAQDEADLAEEFRLRRAFLEAALSKDIQLLQLPCPELTLFGTRRWGHVKDQFDYPYFRTSCRTMLEPLVLQLQDYCQNPDRFQVKGIVSVEGSPSCGFNLTCKAAWGGELSSNPNELSDMVQSVEMVHESGVFMEELACMLKEYQLDIPIVTLQEAIGLAKNSQIQH